MNARSDSSPLSEEALWNDFRQLMASTLHQLRDEHFTRHGGVIEADIVHDRLVAVALKWAEENNVPDALLYEFVEAAGGVLGFAFDLVANRVSPVNN